MISDITIIKKHLRGFNDELLGEIADFGTIQEFPPGKELIREGQYIKSILIVLEGLVKVFTSKEEKELILYYIGTEQSCIVSFASCISNASSRIFTITEEPSSLLLLPADKLLLWVKSIQH